MATYWEIAAHLAYDMLSFVFVPDCQFSFFSPRFLEWGFLSDYGFSTSLLTFYNLKSTIINIQKTL